MHAKPAKSPKPTEPANTKPVVDSTRPARPTFLVSEEEMFLSAVSQDDTLHDYDVAERALFFCIRFDPLFCDAIEPLVVANESFFKRLFEAHVTKDHVTTPYEPFTATEDESREGLQLAENFAWNFLGVCSASRAVSVMLLNESLRNQRWWSQFQMYQVRRETIERGPFAELIVRPSFRPIEYDAAQLKFFIVPPDKELAQPPIPPPPNFYIDWRAGRTRQEREAHVRHQIDEWSQSAQRVADAFFAEQRVPRKPDLNGRKAWQAVIELYRHRVFGESVRSIAKQAGCKWYAADERIKRAKQLLSSR